MDGIDGAAILRIVQQLFAIHNRIQQDVRCRLQMCRQQPRRIFRVARKGRGHDRPVFLIYVAPLRSEGHG